MNEQNEKAERVLEYIERSFTDPSFQPIMDGDLEIVASGKMQEQYVAVSDVFKAITQFTNALTAKGRESFTPMRCKAWNRHELRGVRGYPQVVTVPHVPVSKF